MNTHELKVIDRISKLLALASSPNEHEAMRAAEKAQELMAEYNIELATVQARGGPVDGKRERKTKGHRTVYKWQHGLMDAVASVNFCQVRRKYKRSEKDWRQQVFEGFDIVGRTANVVVTEATFDYLFTTVERLARDFAYSDVMKGRVKPGYSPVYSAEACRFREGCADRITSRLQEKHREIVREQKRKEREARATASHPSAAPTENALVVFADYIQMEDDLNNDVWMGWEPGTTAKRRAQWEAEWRQVEKVAKPAAPETPETAQERARRERASQRWWEAYQRRQDRDAQRRATAGYQAGQDAGDRVGLDQQVKSGGQHRRVK